MKKIVIVEDDPDLSKILDLKFQQSGFKTLLVVDGKDAFETIKSEKPDFVILDILLPNVDGFTILSTLHTDPATKDVPVVVYSNLGDEGATEQVKAVGDYEYFVKTKTDLNDLVEHVREKLKK